MRRITIVGLFAVLVVSGALTMAVVYSLTAAGNRSPPAPPAAPSALARLVAPRAPPAPHAADAQPPATQGEPEADAATTSTAMATSSSSSSSTSRSRAERDQSVVHHAQTQPAQDRPPPTAQPRAAQAGLATTPLMVTPWASPVPAVGLRPEQPLPPLRQLFANPVRPRVMLLVLTAGGKPEAEAAWRAAARAWFDQDTFLVGHVRLPAAEPGSPRVIWLPDEAENIKFEQLPLKVRHMWAHVAEHYLDQYDWFVKVDDDTFVNTHQLRRTLSLFNPTIPVYMGKAHLGPIFGPEIAGPSALWRSQKTMAFCHGGSGYIFSRELLRQLGPVLLDPNFTPGSTNEDTTMGAIVHHALGLRCGHYNGRHFGKLDLLENLHDQRQVMDMVSRLARKEPAKLWGAQTIHSVEPQAMEHIRQKYGELESQAAALTTETDRLAELELEMDRRIFLVPSWQCTVPCDKLSEPDTIRSETCVAICMQSSLKTFPAQKSAASSQRLGREDQALWRNLGSSSASCAAFDDNGRQGRTEEGSAPKDRHDAVLVVVEEELPCTIVAEAAQSMRDESRGINKTDVGSDAEGGVVGEGGGGGGEEEGQQEPQDAEQEEEEQEEEEAKEAVDFKQAEPGDQGDVMEDEELAEAVRAGWQHQPQDDGVRSRQISMEDAGNLMASQPPALEHKRDRRQKRRGAERRRAAAAVGAAEQIVESVPASQAEEEDLRSVNENQEPAPLRRRLQSLPAAPAASVYAIVTKIRQLAHSLRRAGSTAQLFVFVPQSCAEWHQLLVDYCGVTLLHYQAPLARAVRPARATITSVVLANFLSRRKQALRYVVRVPPATIFQQNPFVPLHATMTLSSGGEQERGGLVVFPGPDLRPVRSLYCIVNPVFVHEHLIRLCADVFMGTAAAVAHMLDMLLAPSWYAADCRAPLLLSALIYYRFYGQYYPVTIMSPQHSWLAFARSTAGRDNKDKTAVVDDASAESRAAYIEQALLQDRFARADLLRLSAEQQHLENHRARRLWKKLITAEQQATLSGGRPAALLVY